MACETTQFAPYSEKLIVKYNLEDVVKEGDHNSC